MRHTKIIATVGPASDSDTMLDAIIAAGTDILRLNFSHGTHESQAATLRPRPRGGARANREVAVLQDLGGPKIRTGTLKGGRPIALKPGDALRIVTGDFSAAPGRISTTFDGLAKSVRPGDRLLLGDGRIELRVDAHRRHGDEDDGRRRRGAGGTQRHQRTGRAAADVGDHAEGRRRICSSACRSASTSSRSASCRPRPICGRRVS